jgi:hypothetical protein
MIWSKSDEQCQAQTTGPLIVEVLAMRLFRFAALSAVPLLVLGLATPAGATPGSPVVVNSGTVTRQDLPSQPGSEPDTVVEPDVAVNPTNSDNAIAVAPDSRYSDGGAVGISVAWTYDGGKTWHHRPVPGITKATGGTWDRASDPVVAYAADGTAYLSVLEISLHCPSAVVVLVSRDGGHTWSPPHYAHQSKYCSYSDDKNWIVVDNWPGSPYFGRVYQFWTPFISTSAHFSSPQAVRWSDDQARTWSTTHYVSDIDAGSQNSQPMIRSDGTIVDTFFDFGPGQTPDLVPGAAPERGSGQMTPNIIDSTGPIYSVTSHDGGKTWSPELEVVTNGGGYSPGVRCCLFAADIDPVTQRMYVAFHGGVGNTDPVYISWSDTGDLWSSPERVSEGDVNGVTRVNVDVVARAGNVYVSYGTRTQPADNGGFVQQQLSTSTDGGFSFGPPMSIGPVSVLQYAAQSRGYFPGDYIGAALAPNRLYLVWARSSAPPASSSSPYHQIIWGATLNP